MAVKVFLHICAINHIDSVLNQIIVALHMSGLYKQAEKVYCYISGLDAMIPCVVHMLQCSGAKMQIIKVAPNDTSYERLTLEDMHNHINEYDKVLYIHTKGVTQVVEPKKSNVVDWVYMIQYFLIGNYNECISKLSEYDTVGVNYRSHPRPHWNGNMWWVNGSYFRRLQKHIGPDYFDPELNFLFTCNPTYYEIYKSLCLEHYDYRYPALNFVDKI